MATENKLDLDGAVFFASKDCTSRQDHVFEKSSLSYSKPGPAQLDLRVSKWH